MIKIDFPCYKELAPIFTLLFQDSLHQQSIPEASSFKLGHNFEKLKGHIALGLSFDLSVRPFKIY